MSLINIAIVSDSFKAKSPETRFALKFEPFLLDPTLPADHSVNKRERYVKRFGGEAKVAEMEEAMKARGLPYGIKFSYGGNVRQTTDSHRMIAKAYEKGGEPMQLALVEKLFSGYFEHEKDPAEPNWLSEEAASVGMGSKDEMVAFLQTDEQKAEVAKGIKTAQQLGISGVPFFILHREGQEQQRYGISGAQEPDTFLPVFEKLVA